MPPSARRGRHRAPGPPARPPDVGTAPVLAVLVCHNGSPWLTASLAALRAVTPRPRYVLAVDTGSTDSTAALLSAAADDKLIDGVLTMPAGTAFGAAVSHAVAHAEQRWGDPGQWLWLLHDDSAPEPACLDTLVRAAEASPSVAMLGPLCLDWSDPRLVVEAGLSTDASGHRQTGLGPDELDPALLGGGLAQNTEVLAVGSAGALVRRDVWRQLGGYDPALPMLRDDLDFGWRVNRADHLVLVVPAARIRHAVAGSRGARPLDAVGGTPRRSVDRAHGVRTFLANCSTPSYLLGVPRLVTLCLLRAVAFMVLRRGASARAELHAVWYVLSGRAQLGAARRARRATAVPGSTVRGLLTSRWTRLRGAARGGLLALMRRRMAADAAIGRLPADSASWVAALAAPDAAGAPDPAAAGPAGGAPPGRAAGPAGRTAGSPAGTGWPVGPQALPAGALGRRRRGLAASVAGLRRPGISVVVPAPSASNPLTALDRPAAGVTAAALGPAGVKPADVTAAGVTAVDVTAAGVTGAATGVTGAPPRPSPRPRDAGPPTGELIVVDVGGARLVRELLLAPAVLLVAGLVLAAALVHRGRYGLDLTGGRLAPFGGVAETWSAYLAEWHPVLGGTAAPAPATLAVFGVLGGLLRPFGGGPGAAASLLVLGAIPLAGLSAYFATRRMLVPRWCRALAAAGYALLPVCTVGAVDGRLDCVAAHVLLPAVLAGVAGVLSGWSLGTGGSRAWLPSACATALGLATISAFAPLVHVLVLVLVLAGFVAVPGPRGQGLRRIVALFVIVLLPLGLLLPWPAVVLQHPAVLLHGAGAVVAEAQLDPRRLLLLDAGGGGPLFWLGGVVLLGCLTAVVARPRRAAVPGLVVATVGLAAAFVVTTLTAAPLPGGTPRTGWPGAALLLAACGLMWAALAVLSTAPGHAATSGISRRMPHSDTGQPRLASTYAAQQGGGGAMGVLARRGVPAVAAGVVGLLALSAVLIGGGGSLVTERPRLAAPIQAEAGKDRTGVLVIGQPGEPVRAAVGRLPAAGDDDLAPVATAPARMARWAAAFRSGHAGTAQAAALEASVSGIEFVVLPDRASADGLLGAAGALVAGAPDTTDGRPTVRLLPAPAPAVVLAPQVADQAQTGGAPPVDYGMDGVVAVPAAPPAVGVITGPGSRGRALVVAAEMEDGWLATVDGQRTQVARAWGHLVAVSLPAEAAEVRVERSSTLRTLLLLVQLAVALFTAITAIPPGERNP